MSSRTMSIGHRNFNGSARAIALVLGMLGATSAEARAQESVPVRDSVFDARRCTLLGRTSPTAECRLYNASIVELIARPERWDELPVRVRGYLRLEFEGTRICLSKESADQSLSRNCLWVSFSPDFERPGDEIADRFVLLEGRFDADHPGHMNAYSGAILDITRVVARE